MGRLVANAVCFDAEYIYFTCQNVNVIGYININNLNVDYIMGPTDEPFYYEHLYEGIQVKDDKLMLFPYNAKRMYIYYLYDKEWIAYDILENNIDNGKEQVCGSVLYGDKIYILSDYYGDIIRYDILNNQFDRPFTLPEKTDKFNIAFGGQSVAKKEEVLYIAQQYSNTIIKCNMKTNESSFIDIDGGGGFIGTHYDGEYIWIIPRTSQNKLIKWREKDKYLKTYDIPKKNYIWGITPLGKKYILYGYYENALLFDGKNNNYEVFESIFRAKEVRKNEIVLCTSDGQIVMYRDGIEIFKVDLGKNLLDEYYKQYGEMIAYSWDGNIISECPEATLNDYINFIMNC